MLGLNETMDRLAMANSVRCYVHVLRREDCHVLRRAFDFEAEGERKKERSTRIWKRQVEEESMKVGLRKEDALCYSEWSVGVKKDCSLVEVNVTSIIVGELPYFKDWCLSFSHKVEHKTLEHVAV